MKTKILLKTGLCASMALVAWAGTPAAFATTAAPAASAPAKTTAAPAKKAASGVSTVPAASASTYGGGKKGPVRPTGTASAVTQ